MIKIGLLVLASALAVMAQIDDGELDYQNCTKGLKTSICKYPVSFTRYSGGTEEATEILDCINIYRANLYNGLEIHAKSGRLPASSAIQLLSWSNELARQAIQWAAQCKPGFDECLKLAPAKTGYVGQTRNSSLTHGKYENPITIVRGWYENEIEHFDRKLIANFNPDRETLNKISNVSQMLWSGTTEVGCARVVEEVGDELYKTTLVCNWKPSGNIFGKYVYEIKASLRNEDEKKRYHELHLS